MKTVVRKNYSTLDLGKFIAATMIIMLHANPMESISGVVGSVFRSMIYIIAVPFFFTTGGFLFFDKIISLPAEGQRKSLGRYVKTLGKTYLIWSAVYFPFVAMEWHRDGIQLLAYIRDFFLEGSFSTIWYLPASIVATAFTYFLYQRTSVKKTFFICLGCYAVGCAFSYYYYIFHKVPLLRNVIDAYYSFFKTTKNGILFGAVFAAIGLIIALQPNWLTKRSCIYGCIVSYILLVGESGILPALHILNRSVDLKLFLAPFSFFLVMLLVQVELPDRKVFRWMRKMSTNMFLCQRLFLTAYPMIFPENSVWIQSNWRFFVLVYTSTLAFSELMYLVGECRLRQKKTRG